MRKKRKRKRFFFFFRKRRSKKETKTKKKKLKKKKKNSFTSNGSFGSLFRSCTTDSVSCAFFRSSSAFMPRPTTLAAL